MISDNDRSGWFGASDCGFIMGSWNTKTFERWWLQKLGVNHDHFQTDATAAGTYWEHTILDHIGVAEKDKQILIPELLLRINLDGNTGSHIVEVKTHKVEKVYTVSAAHRRQVNVQMFGMRYKGHSDATAEVAAYGLTDYDYSNFFGEIEPGRLTRHPVEYDEGFIRKYLPRLEYLRDCLQKGAWPCEKST
jgi:hypothetical protein